MSIEISVIVPTYRRPHRIQRLVRALADQTIDAGVWELIVVDDGSGADLDDLYDHLGEGFPARFRVLRTERNGGPDPARNVGWRAAAASEFLAFLDDDVLPDRSWLEAGRRALEADPTVGVVQGLTTAPPGVAPEELPEWWLWREVAAPTPYFEGCNIFYRRRALEVVGGFTVDLGMHGNDSATGWAVIEAGWARGFAPDARVVHDVERRSLRWWIGNGTAERAMVAAAARHPGYRSEAFWRPWAVRKRDAAFAVALASGAIGLAWHPALIGVLPYLRWGRPSLRRPGLLRRCAETVAVDAARFAGHVRGALDSRTLVV